MVIRTRWFELIIFTRKNRVERELLRNGKVAAVKLARELYGIGLKEAVDMVNEMEEKIGKRG